MRDEADTTLILKRTFKAPVSAVWDAWTRPEHFSLWMGPEADMTCTTGPFDVSPGGSYAFEITGGDGNKHGARGEFREVVEHQKLVLTWTWDHMPDVETLVTVEFRGDGDTTHLTLTHQRHSTIESRDNHRRGWTGSFDRLERLLATPAN